jgi:glycopeptide antibiotics resistance protein
LLKLNRSFVHSAKKIVVLSPALLIIAFIISDYVTYPNSRSQNLNVTLNMLPLIIFVFIFALQRRQDNAFAVILQTSYFIYLYGVLYNAVFLIPYTDILLSMANSNLSQVISSNLEQFQNMYNFYGATIGINLIPFRKFIDYSLHHRQVVGNLAMLFPLGFYLPLLYKRIHSFKKVLLVSLLVAVTIELTQLIFTFLTPVGSFYFRAFDVDDIILNTAGACVGYLLYLHLAKIYGKAIKRNRTSSEPNS